MNIQKDIQEGRNLYNLVKRELAKKPQLFNQETRKQLTEKGIHITDEGSVDVCFERVLHDGFLFFF